MRRLFGKLVNGLRQTPRARARQGGERRARPQVEALETRQLLSNSPLPALSAALPSAPSKIIILDPIQIKYWSLGGPGGFLGNAVTPELPTPYGGGLYELFQHGAIYWSASTGAHDIYGAIENEFFTTASEHDAYGINVQKILGLPTSDEMNVPWLPGGRMNTFQGGTIYWSATTGAHVVYGGIGAEYAHTAFETDAYGVNVQKILGLPTSDEMDVPGVSGGRMNTFHGGTIYWSASTGAHVVYGGIGGKYNSVGGPAAYGLPLSDEAWVPGVPGERVNYFQGGRAIYWSAATGAHLVYGAIGAEYAATAFERDYYNRNVQYLLGAPTSDEMNVPGVPGARMNTFQGGVIYWSPSTGAHVVYGGIGGKYNSLGGPLSFLGLPTSDEMSIPGGRVSYFQHGSIVWSPGGGAVAL
jgi:uncharacterized protein with LGFP repeats